MRKFNLGLILLFMAVIMGLQGCIRDSASFVVDTFTEMVIPAGLSADRTLSFTPRVFFPYSQQLSLNNISPENVESVNGALGLATPQFNAITDLSFIAEIEIDVLDPTNPQSGREIFHYVQRDFRRRSELELTPSIPNVRDLIVDDMLFLKIDVSFNTPPPATFTLIYDLQLAVFEMEDM